MAEEHLLFLLYPEHAFRQVIRLGKSALFCQNRGVHRKHRKRGRVSESLYDFDKGRVDAYPILT